MPKINVKNATSATLGVEESEVFVTDGGLSEGSPADSGDGAAITSSASAAESRLKPFPGVILEESQAATRSGQIAAKSAMNVAYWCVYGQMPPEHMLVAWSEGSYVMEVPLPEAQILSRICTSLGVRTFVQPPAE